MKVRDLVAALLRQAQEAECLVMGNWWNEGADISVTHDGRVFVSGAGNMLQEEPPTAFVHQEEVLESVHTEEAR